eukprot:TRINITY_DN169_c0_g1_i1.p1 TRINITY_DN169_c0_g1~~TRINITY_DN169_c0_g1_i1.p1  ORF type:complete len:331 (-),score=111.68 TRINITY_DN169_c0_g1_i1:183-1175(-)
MKSLCLLVLVLLLGSASAFRALTAQSGDVNATLWDVGSEASTPPYALVAQRLGSVPVGSASPIPAFQLVEPEVVMLGEPDQFDRTFIASASGLFMYDGTDKHVHEIDTPFRIARPLTGCRDQRTIDYFLVFLDADGAAQVWKFTPPFTGVSGWQFKHIEASLSLKADVGVPDKCAYDNSVLSFYAHYAANTDQLVNVAVSSASVTMEPMQAMVLAMGNSPSTTRPFGLVASGTNEPVTFATELSSDTTVDLSRAVVNPRGTTNASGPVRTRTPSFCPVYATSEMWYAASPQGPVVSAAATSFNGKPYVRLDARQVMEGWPATSYVLALSN